MILGKKRDIDPRNQKDKNKQNIQKSRNIKNMPYISHQIRNIAILVLVDHNSLKRMMTSKRREKT